MRMRSKPLTERRNLLMRHLTAEGFTVGRTEHGFVAVDDDGIVFTVSPVRTHVCRVDPVTEKIMEIRTIGMPDTAWCNRMISELGIWASQIEPPTRMENTKP